MKSQYASASLIRHRVNKITIGNCTAFDVFSCQPQKEKKYYLQSLSLSSSSSAVWRRLRTYITYSSAIFYDVFQCRPFVVFLCVLDGSNHSHHSTTIIPPCADNSIRPCLENDDERLIGIISFVFHCIHLGCQL